VPITSHSIKSIVPQKTASNSVKQAVKPLRRFPMRDPPLLLLVLSRTLKTKKEAWGLRMAPHPEKILQLKVPTDTQTAREAWLDGSEGLLAKGGRAQVAHD